MSPEGRLSAWAGIGARGACADCGAHVTVTVVDGAPRGVCAVCGGERLSLVVEADGRPAPPLPGDVPPAMRHL